MSKSQMTTPKKGVADTTLRDLFSGLGATGGIAGWAAIVMLLLQWAGCSSPSIPEKRPNIFKPPLRADVPNAIGRISMGNVGCTATIIGPVSEDDREISILTAAHCIKVGQTGTMKLKDGRSFSFKCVSRNADADCAWLTAPRPEGNVPFAYLADKLPEKGDAVWHQGYGIDNPGNLEKGTFQGVTANGAQAVFTLSVSSGDSGGGIVATKDGAVISPVCCTTRLSGTGNVMGSTPMNAAAIRPGRVADVTAEEVYRPILILPNPQWEEPPGG